MAEGGWGGYPPSSPLDPLPQGLALNLSDRLPITFLWLALLQQEESTKRLPQKTKKKNKQIKGNFFQMLPYSKTELTPSTAVHTPIQSPVPQVFYLTFPQGAGVLPIFNRGDQTAEPQVYHLSPCSLCPPDFVPVVVWAPCHHHPTPALGSSWEA